MKKTSFTINGKVYNSLDEAPPAYRALLEDKDSDGVPDILNKVMEGGRVGATTSYTYNNIKYNSPEDMPPAIREMFEKMRQKSQFGDSEQSNVNIKVTVNQIIKTTDKTASLEQAVADSLGNPAPKIRDPQQYIDQLKKLYPTQNSGGGKPGGGGFWSRLFGKKG